MSKEHLQKHRHQASKGRQVNQRGLDEFGETRRRTLKLLGLGVAGTAAVGLGFWRPWELGGDFIDPQPEKAQQTRQEIKDYVGSHPEDLSDEAITHIFELNKHLYTAAFGRSLAPVKLQIVTNEKLRAQGLGEITTPQGSAAQVNLILDRQGGRPKVESISLAIFTGKPESYNPGLPKLQIIDAIIKHELIHTQTEPKYGFIQVEVGDHPKVMASGVRGLKWIGISTSTFPSSELSIFFDEVNTQLLTEYMNDPANQDNIFREIAKSNSPSITPAYIEAAALLRRIHGALEISPFEVKKFHQHADPKGLLDRIDLLSKERGYVANAKPSTTLLTVSPSGESFSSYHLPLWAKLAEKYPAN